jgi:hypothetical protein
MMMCCLSGRLRILVICTGIAVAAGQLRSAEVTWSRSEVAERLQQSVVLSSSIAQPQHDRCRQQLAAAIRKATVDLLPENLPADSTAAIVAATSGPIIVKYTSDRYIELLARIHVLNVKAKLAFSSRFPPLSTDEKEKLLNNVVGLMGAVRQSLRRHLTGVHPVFSADIIDRAVDRTEASLARRIGTDPYSSRLVQPLAESDIAKLSEEFDSRLLASLDVVAARLEASDGADATLVAIRDGVLAEVLSRVTKVFESRTTDRRRAEFDAEPFAPGLAAMGRELAVLEHKLSTEATTDP